MEPGRSCPLHYRYSPHTFARAADLHADTLYVIGGLYGNGPALQAILDLAAHERTTVTLVFNGDFNWFNVSDESFRAINDVVLRHHALRGNVETEIASDDASAGCGCAYPDNVAADDVERSNQIILQLRDTARRHHDLRRRLAALPMHCVADVRGLRVAIVHGDLESLAGWSLAQDALATNAIQNIIKKQLVTATCPVVVSSHTCLPVAQTLDTSLGPCAIFNNGAAGMPNFRDMPFGVITRIALTPARTSLYGTRIGNTYIDAVAVEYETVRWHHEFVSLWPEGSAAHQSYHQRIVRGPAYTVGEANRLTVSNIGANRLTADA